MHCLTAITVIVSMCLVHKNTQTSTPMRRLTAITVIVSMCTRTHSTSKRIHRLAAITVSMRLVHKNTHTQAHACIATQQSQ